GSCGNVNSDSSYIVALSYSQVDGGAHCGRTVSITNNDNGKTITATVADTCPGCGYGSLDLSTGAFGAIGSYDQGVLPISWSFTS
ncbi:barwin-like endoglucanase, partial [Rhodotorula sp. JG-1b]